MSKEQRQLSTDAPRARNPSYDEFEEINHHNLMKALMKVPDRRTEVACVPGTAQTLPVASQPASSKEQTPLRNPSYAECVDYSEGTAQRVMAKLKAQREANVAATDPVAVSPGAKPSAPSK